MAEEESSSVWSSSRLWLGVGAAGLLGAGALSLALYFARRPSYPPQWQPRFGDRAGPAREPLETVLARHAERFSGETTNETAQKLFQNSQWREAAAAVATLLQRQAPTEELYSQLAISLHRSREYVDSVSVGYHALHDPTHARTFEGVLDLTRTTCNSLCNLYYYELSVEWLRSTIDKVVSMHKADFFVAAAYCTLADLLIIFAQEFEKTPEVSGRLSPLFFNCNLLVTLSRRPRSRTFSRFFRMH